MGRRAARRRAEAGAVASRSASTKGAAGIAASVSRHAEGDEGRTPAPDREARGRAGAKLAGGLRARPVPARSLLDPERSRPHDRRGRERMGSGLRAQGDRRALRARREPRVSPRWTRARRSLPRPRAADAARGPECHCVCAAQRASPPRQARPRLPATRADRSGVIGAVVHGLAHGSACVPRSAGRRSASQLAAQRRLAPPGADRSCGGSGLARRDDAQQRKPETNPEAGRAPPTLKTFFSCAKTAEAASGRRYSAAPGKGRHMPRERLADLGRRARDGDARRPRAPRSCRWRGPCRRR